MTKILSFEEYLNERKLENTELESLQEETVEKNEDLDETKADELNEKEIKDEKAFREWAETYLKQAHGDDYDQEIADKTIEGLMDKYDGDWGAMVGALKSN